MIRFHFTKINLNILKDFLKQHAVHFVMIKMIPLNNF